MSNRPMTVAEVAEYLSCSSTHVYALIEAKSLRAFSVGSKRGLRVTQQEVERWVAEKQESRLQSQGARSDGATAKPLPTTAMKLASVAG